MVSIKNEHLAVAAVGTLAVLQFTSLVGHMSSGSSSDDSRRLSVDLGGGQCAWTKATTYPRWEVIPRPTTLFAGYPGSGKRLAWMMVEALTGHVAGDDWDLSQHGTHVVAMKTGYPHHEGKWGWGDYMDQVILEVRNPRWALPSYHTMRTELDWSETWSQSFFRIPWVYTERPPNEQWEAWRDANFDKEILEYGKYIDFWMEGGVMPHDDGSTTQDVHCGTPDSVGWMDMPNCKPKAVVMFENLFDNSTAHNGMTLGANEMYKIAQVIDDSPDSTVIANDAWYCIYNATYGNHRFNRHRDPNPKYPDSVPRETYNFTVPQYESMIAEVTRLYNKYSNPPWDTDPLAQDLASYLLQYIGELNDELYPLKPQPPCARCTDGYTASFDDTTFGPAVQLYLTDRDSAVAQYGVMNCWDVFQVTSTFELFRGKNFNEDIGCWDTRNIVDMTDMFRASQFNQDISEWDVGGVTSLYRTFLSSAFNQDLSKWDVTSVEDARQTFYRASSYNQGLCAWRNKLEITEPTQMNNMFTESACPLQDRPDLGTDPPGPFCNTCPLNDCTSCPNGYTAAFDDLSFYDAVNLYLTDRNSAVSQYGEISCWDTAEVTDMSGLFWGKNFNEDISCWNTRKVTDMTDMFRASQFNQDIAVWDVGSVTSMYRTFLSSKFNHDLSHWDISAAEDIRLMFYRAADYNHGLCEWGDKVTMTDPYMLNSMFLDSSCPEKARPDILSDPKGPFCVQCT